VRCSSVLPRGVGAGRAAGAAARARAGWRGDAVRDASRSVRTSLPRVRRAVARQHRRRPERGPVLAPRQSLRADVPGAAAATRGRPAGPAPADDVARSPRRDDSGVATWSVCSVAAIRVGRGGGPGRARQRAQPYAAPSDHCEAVPRRTACSFRQCLLAFRCRRHFLLLCSGVSHLGS